ncbi:DUF1800 domain-containing protein [Undibacterium griseum]|uniref:DUF1800 domain-containing protein n=1 Tax=Undibacterium griseum TaxID=2762295 RepID=A0ABR6YIR6_9BURK|nr:DUF1800 domain-containing protein [Undibacterium griseum]MBC3883744.1 DUF1800 domain-containing protein [Undibacterium griseum]
MLTAAPLSRFVSTGFVFLLAACAHQPPSSTNTATYKAPPPASKVLSQAGVRPEQLLNRVTWGSNFSTYQQLQAVGTDLFLHQQLWGRATVVPPVVQAQISAMTISQQPLDQMIFALEKKRIAAEQQKGTDDSLRKDYQQELNRLAREAMTRSLLRDIYSPNQLQEQMTWFWMNHFNIHSGKHNLRAMLGDFEENAIRPHALGNFRDLLKATVYHPAMLRYLDNEHNAVNRINENYARELMELHTMGVNSGYTQRDVQELARVLTGVGVNLTQNTPKIRPELSRAYVRRGLFEFNPQRHDFGEKQILGTRIPGRGLNELEDVLTLLSRQPATARYISQKLAVYFVSDTPSEALIQSMATSFLESDGNIPRTLLTMFESQEFIASLGNKFKDPLHYTVSSIRLAYDGNCIVNTGPILNWLNMMGEPLNGRQTPDGYAMTESAWASPGQMATRFDVARALSAGTPALFKADNQTTLEKPPAPALANSMYVKTLSQTLGKDTQQTLQQAKTPAEWNMLFLASPEMMRR